MKRRKSGVGSLFPLIVAFFLFSTSAISSAGDSTDKLAERIRQLEDVQKNNAQELDRLKGQQLELKKQATEAAAALPTFSYRPGSGILMESADKSWSIRLHNRIHYWLMFRQGDANADTEREGLGELFARRIRPTFFYCVNNCLYEMEASLDLDSEDAVALQRATAYIHLEQLNVWLPTFYFGIDSPTTWNRRRSSSSGAQLDYDILSRSLGNTFSQGWNYALLWQDKPLDWIGIPGQIEWFTIAVGSGPGNGSDGRFIHSDKKSYITSLGISPFSRLKNKWLSGLELSWGAWFCQFDTNATENGACDDARMRETDGFTKAVLWDANVPDENALHRLHGASLRWRIGAYQLLGTLHFFHPDASIRHRNWYIGHELYVWSPKGFLTGSASTPGSVMIGTHFERSDGQCSPALCDNDGEFTNNHVTLASAHISYWIQRGLRVGVHWNHYDAKKIPASVQEDLDIRSTGVPGRGGDWDNVMVIFGWEF
ncbi:MAG TPA: hypothetical protein VE616_08445 [Candidatus Udaeobacter sp.]|jgi:hypothetical protein|nr:hypothetical protein [Candidatus Udaeobacter sp.]